MVVTRLELTNFKSHRRLVVDFGPVTAIIGPNNSGKTNVLRALEWLCLNPPWTFERTVTAGESEVSVRGVLADGTVIERRRTAKVNQYRITHADGRDTVFDKVGAGPLPEVTALTGVQAVVLAGGKVQANFHFHPAGYTGLVDRPPGDLAAIFGEVSGVGGVDAAVRLAQSDAASLRQRLKQARLTADQAAARAAALAPDLALPTLAETAEQALACVQAAQQRVATLASLGDAWQTAARATPDPAPARAALARVQAAQTAVNAGRQNVAALSALAAAWQTTTAAVAQHRAALVDTQRALDDAQRTLTLCPLCGQSVGPRSL